MFRRFSDWVLLLFRAREEGVVDPDTAAPIKPRIKVAPDPDVELDDVPEQSSALKLNHATKGRAKRPKKSRPSTRQSAMPRTGSESSLKVDENIEEFFSTPSTPVDVSNKEDSSSKSSSTKSTPESKKKLGGIFNKGIFHRDKDNKDSKGKEAKKSKTKASPKSSPSPKRISDVPEELEEPSSNKISNDVPSNMDKISEQQNGESDRSSRKSDDLESSSKDSDSKSDISKEGSPDKVADNESTEPKVDEEAKDSESDTEKESEQEKENVTDEIEVEKEEKKPLQLPKTKRSVRKPDEKEEIKAEEQEEEKSEEKEEVKDSVEDENDNKDTEDKEGDTKETKEEVKGEKTEAEKDTEPEEEDKVEHSSPVSKPKIPGAVGFGMNIMADLKAHQEKRKSQMPISRPTQPLTDKSRSPVPEEKKPFGFKHLKPVPKSISNDSIPDSKHSTTVPTKPSAIKSGEPENSSVSPALDKKVSLGSTKRNGGANPKHVTADAKTDQIVTKNNSVKENAAEKPTITPRPLGFSKPPPPTRPKPPTTSRPTPAPRKSMSSNDIADHVRYRHSYDGDNDVGKMEENLDMTDSGIVYDADTPRLSARDATSVFGGRETRSKKAGSLLVNASDLIRAGSPDNPKRPQSMFAKVDSQPDTKKQTDVDGKILETNSKTENKEAPESPTEEIILV